MLSQPPDSPKQTLPSLLVDLLIEPPEGPYRGAYEAYTAYLMRSDGSSNAQHCAEVLTERFAPHFRAFLNEVVGSHAALNVSLAVVPSGRYSVECLIADGAPYVVFHQGFFDLLSFDIEVMLVGEKIKELPIGSALKEQLLSRLATFRSLLLYRRVEEPFPLPLLRKCLSESANDTESLLLFAAETFVVLHELAHVRLGHLEQRAGVDSESIALTTPNQFRHSEPGASEKLMELEADVVAVDSVTRHRDAILHGALVFLTTIGSYQNFMVQHSDTHPHAANRLAALRDRHVRASHSLRGQYDAVVDGLTRDRDLMHGAFITEKRQYVHQLHVDALVEELTEIVAAIS